ncbi:SDR family NAD(P)-dependent oxidoreductase [Bradyrhizobium viridifuturi]|jgi:NAD(P)-dependent dehydrogenase (short-subunit alcohol dehydrogenase family)|nr:MULTISPECIES: SDR family NAD(P)-dependent oxidoreductase [Bradyrhizobium]ERF86619.1 MAG: two-component system, chemotaxis family, sensor kinase CheA [Bradyrhizobium sp. DFCI-1]MBR2119747.1 SDR family NAD(P)-dependent oxidoreductase [Afipia sp.]MCA3798122.1 SDR family NAD(P)-dependent oxidoreductase [Burkholderia sp.]MBI5322134.1 SDR family NAD(P)-dependent oxidoreductase [Bradyrhizobium sp.]MBR1037876.1 SDR family NAD(P)-dependent oxidoreductase [Bradyrhizobium viridifuturi]
MELHGKIAVVTGAASGLGLATCKVLAAAGVRIAGFDRDEKKLQALKSNLGDACLARVVDVAEESSVKDGIAAVVAAFGGVHVAVNCAGVADAAKTVSKGEPFPIATWNKVIAINLTGTFNVIRFAALAMTRNTPDAEGGERGVIVNTASGAASQGQVGQAAYSASKAGVIGLTLPVARDLAPHGIRIVSIAPGLFDTAMVAGIPDNVSQSIVDRMILYPNRMGQPREFARLVQHIVENSYLNATTLDLDAGARMQSR